MSTSIKTLADAVTGFGNGPVSYFPSGEPYGVIYIDFDGTNFTGFVEGRPEDGDEWQTIAQIDESTDPPCQQIVLAPQMRLRVQSFTGNTLTVKISISGG
jgi:hypothetical protein